MGVFVIILLIAFVGIIILLLVRKKRRQRADFCRLILAADREEEGAREALYRAMDRFGINDNESYIKIRENMYREMVKQGDPFAMVMLGQSIQDDNPQEAYTLFTEAAKQGNALAMSALGAGYSEYFNRGGRGRELFGYDPVLSFRWYLKAAELGDVHAIFTVAHLFFSGEGVDKSESLAYQWALRGANLGDADCAELLSYAFYDNPSSAYYNKNPLR